MARCLPSLPHISGALAKGEISYAKVRALTRIVDAASEAELHVPLMEDREFTQFGTTPGRP